MPFSPPVEVQHYRGNTLTPESPRPLHIPEPSNIPVLQNQIDPIFNLMSTHMEPPHALRDLTAMDHNMTHGAAPTAETTASRADTVNDDNVDYDPIAEDLYGSARSEDGDAMSWGMNDIKSEQTQSDSSLNQTHTSLLADQLSTSMASYDTLPTTTQKISEPLPSSISLSTDSSQHFSESYEPSQTTPTTNGQNTSPTRHDANEANLKTEEYGDESVANGGVNYQTLLDNISPSTASAPKPGDLSITTLDSLRETTDNPTPANANFPLSAPALAGLPPRPPPQEKPAIHPNYTPGEDIRSYHFPHNNNAGTHTTHTAQPNNSYRPPQPFAPSVVASGAPGTSSAHNGLPPPPMATFQQPTRPVDQMQRSPINQQNHQRNMSGRNGTKNASFANAPDGDVRFSPEVERLYDAFLSDERIYTAEGTWDRFPAGSRLFVGNLPSEVVSKRDIFEIFYKYGKLAQISIKQAYGFVQFLDPSACHTAMQGEQNKRIKDRNMHLEISKPQKNSRNALATAAGDSLRAGHYRRSRSPDYGRRSQTHGLGPRPGIDRFVPSSDFRDEPRRRDDYRPGRSPSPRGYRGRDEYRGGRDRSPDRYYGGRRSRSRSPFGRNARYRSPSPRVREIDEEASLPIPRRDARDVPDVQLILVDELDRAFVAYIETTFRERGLRCAVLVLPRVSLAAVIKRQILEGVQAVVKLHRNSQLTGKIPLQLFDRTSGADNVRFEEYDELEVRIAAELVIRAKTIQAAVPIAQSQYAGPPQPYAAPPYSQQPPPPPAAIPVAQPNIANLITSLDGPALQKLLGAMQQTPQTPQTQQQHIPQQSPVQNPDLSALLGNVGMQQPNQQQMHAQQGYPYAQHQPQQQVPQQYPYGAQYQPSHQQTMVQQHQQAQPGQHQHVQNIMEQLAKWKQ